MAKYTGTVKHNDLEGGFLELHTDDNEIYRLQGATQVSPGDRVVVEGTVDSGGFGLQMTGPALNVTNITKA